MNKKCMAANWKMFKTRQEAEETTRELMSLTAAKLPSDREVLLIPPFTAIASVAATIGSKTGFGVGAQNFYPAENGAYTGEISPDMLLDLGCSWALVGHSERRHLFHEDNEFLAQKVRFGLERGLNIILCIGETLNERKNGQLATILNKQLTSALSDIGYTDIASRLVVAYEPVWAIGTGEVARTEDIREAHDYVRSELKKIFSSAADSIRILYGGSVKPDNISEIITLDNVDGVLVGGASLQAESFSRIVLG
ncbi:MAG: triose-phosphate isomerase [Desulfohalobiaceae bacterium]|nr:triose-phosphate isomerase [Desulfohalobiaceae bacterium]